MRELHDHAELLALCGTDTLPRWAAQGLTGPSRAWAKGTAVAVAGPWLSERDRLALHGDPDDLADLVPQVLSIVGPTYRPLADESTIDTLVQRLPNLRPTNAFGWMDRTDPVPAPNPTAHWLTDADRPEIAALIESAFPNSYARPDTPGVQRWAGVRTESGALVAVAALAWSAPSVGLLAGITVDPTVRGKGLGREVCTFAVSEALREYGTVALMVDRDNQPARRLYESLGLTYRAVKAASQRS